MENIYNRNPTITIIRVFAMTLVVAYHSLCLYADNWNKFFPEHTSAFTTISVFMNKIHLPLFIFVSGMLFQIGIDSGKYKKKKEFIKKKAKRLLLPYLIWGIILIIIFPYFYNLYSLLYGICHLWFLLMLWWIFLLSIFTNKIWDSFSILIKVLFMIGYILFYEASKCIAYKNAIEPSFLTWSSVLYYLPIFLWGRMMYQNDVEFKSKLNIKTSIAILLTLLSILWWLTQSQVPHKDMYILIDIIPILFFLLQIVSHVKMETIPRPIYKLDNYCMGIYIFHHIIIWLIIIIMPFILYQNYLGFLILFIGSFIVSYIFSIDKYEQLFKNDYWIIKNHGMKYGHIIVCKQSIDYVRVLIHIFSTKKDYSSL